MILAGHDWSFVRNWDKLGNKNLKIILYIVQFTGSYGIK